MYFDMMCDHKIFMNFVEPIRDRKKIAQIKNQLRGQRRYRDLLLFVLGINTALRISDLLELLVEQFLDDQPAAGDDFVVLGICMKDYRGRHHSPFHMERGWGVGKPQPARLWTGWLASRGAWRSCRGVSGGGGKSLLGRVFGSSQRRIWSTGPG